MQNRRWPVVLGLALLAPACARRPENPADLIVITAQVYTADSAQWTAEAFAVDDGKVVFVGSRSGAMAYKGDSTSVRDLAGAFVYPGLVDAHAHVVNLGLRGVDLMGTPTYD